LFELTVRRPNRPLVTPLLVTLTVELPGPVSVSYTHLTLPTKA